MNRFTGRLIVFLAGLSIPLGAQVDSLYVDFGSSQLKTASPDAQGHFWNNVTDLTPTGLPNLINDLGQSAGIPLQLAGAVYVNPFGTTVPNQQTLGGLAVSTATQDWFYVADQSVITVTLKNLAPDGIYRLSLFGSRDSVDTRITRFDVVGLTTEVRRLTTSGLGIGAAPQVNANRSDLAIFDNLLPAADGSLTISVRRDTGSFGYLGALRLETMNVVNSPPAADGVSAWGAPRVGSPLVGRYAYSDRENDLEGASTFIWERSSTPTATPASVSQIDNAVLSYVPSPTDEGCYFRFGVIPKAVAGRGTGTVFYSPWVGPIVSPGTFRSFHIGSSYTQWANMPLQLRNLGAASGQPIFTGWQVTSGQNSRYHWENGLSGPIGSGTYSRYELASGAWDAVVLQPFNSEWQPWQINQILDYGKRFYDLADSNGAQFYLYAAWPARGQSLATQTDINAAFERIRSTISVGGNKAALVIPAGEAFRAVIQEAATGYLKSFNTSNSLDRQNLYIDDLHQTDLGAYVSALTHYATVMKRSPVGLPPQALDAYPWNDNPVTFNPALATRIQEIVWWVVANYPTSGVVASVAKPAEIIIPPEPEYPPPVFVTLSGAPSDPTLLKLAFGPSSDGFNAPAQNLPHSVASATEGNITIQYTVNPAAEADGVTFTPHWSDDLSRWNLTQPASAVITRVNNTVTVTWSMASRWRFFRVFVSKP